jgi:SAM-dependent methyltransferase
MENQNNQLSWVDARGVTHKGLVCQVVDGFSVIDCEYCRFKHVVPLPTAHELETIYSHEYYTQEKPLYIERYLEDKTWWDGVYAERYETLEQYLGGTGSILDVGSGPGLFLDLGRNRGWSVKGIEPSLKAADYSRHVLGLDIENIFLDAEIAPTLGQFDVVNMGEVLEHLPDPAGMLEIARGLLKRDGLLMLVVPNDFNPFQIILRDHLGFSPWWVAPPHHLNYFSHESLKFLVERLGFNVLHMESTFPIDMFLMMGKDYIGNDALGREVHGLRKVFDKNLFAGGGDLRRKLYSALADRGLGREVVLYARKLE